MESEESNRGWASTKQALAERRAAARQWTGERVVQVRYVDLDYNGWHLGYRDQASRRVITDAAEWEEPTWDGGTFHFIDYGIEFVTEEDRTWSITWDTRGGTENLCVRTGVAASAGAVWDVTSREPWKSCTRFPLGDLVLRYHPWVDRHASGFWCSRASLVFGSRTVEALLGDQTPGSAELCPASENIAVLLDPIALPSWESTDDLV
jgi:hypothetical protein